MTGHTVLCAQKEQQNWESILTKRLNEKLVARRSLFWRKSKLTCCPSGANWELQIPQTGNNSTNSYDYKEIRKHTHTMKLLTEKAVGAIAIKQNCRWTGRQMKREGKRPTET